MKDPQADYIARDLAGEHPRLRGGILYHAAYSDVHGERTRAHMKHGANGNSREDAAPDNSEWLPILMEEVGEVAHELTYDGSTGSLRKELVQVAAMAIAWIEAIDAAR